MKRQLALILVLALLLSMTPISVLAEEAATEHAEPIAVEQPVPEEPDTDTVYPVEEPLNAVYSGTCGENVTWSLDTTSGVLTISGSGAMSGTPWSGDSASIKTVIIENGVTSIGNEAFRGCSSLTSVTIPDSVTSIGGDAFYDCSSLTSVTIPDGVTSIGYNAFRYCNSLTSVTIPNSVTSIGNYAFFCCNRLTGVYITDLAAWCKISFSDSANNPLTYAHNLYLNGEIVTDLVIPNSVTTISAYAFYDCSLTSVTIPNSVTSIGGSAFSYCSSLTSVTIGNGVKTIATSAFAECEQLKDVYFVGTEADWDAIQIGTGNGYLLDAQLHFTVSTDDTFTLIQPEHGTISLSLRYAIVGETVTVRLDGADLGYVLDKVIVDGQEIEGTSFTVQSAGSHTVTASLKQLYTAVAGGSCGNGVSWALTADGELHVFGTGAMASYSTTSYFDSATGSSTSRTTAPWGGLSQNIKSVIVEDGVTNIGAYAFAGCNSFTSITIPESVTAIGSYAFTNCSALASVSVSNLETWLNVNLASPASNPLYNGAKLCENGAPLAELVIPESFTTVMPYSLCYADIVIPASVTNIAANAFASGRLWLEKDSAAEQWAIGSRYAYGYVGTNTLMGFCGENVRFAFDMETGTLTISGDGAIPGYNTASYADASGYATPRTMAPWGQFYENLKTVIIEDGVTGIGQGAFYGCTNILSITVPKSVQTTGQYAFAGCNLMTLTGFCGENVTYSFSASDGRLTISGTGAMYDYAANRLPHWLPVQTTSSSYNYNYNYNSSYYSSYYPEIIVRKVTFEDGVTHIGSYAFYQCTALTNAEIPESVTSIGACAFYNCYNLDVTIPKSVTTIGQQAFYTAVTSAGARITVWVSRDSAAEEYAKENRIMYGCVETNTVHGYCGETVTFALSLNDGVLTISGSGPMADYNNSYSYSTSNPNIPWSRYSSYIRTVVIEEGVTTIGMSAFYQCNNVSRITIPESVTGISINAFVNVASILFMIKEGSAAEQYLRQNGWNYLYLKTYSGTCGKAVTWSLNPEVGVLTISGSGAMQDYNAYDVAPWSSYSSVIKEVVIENGVTTIGSYAFRSTAVSTSYTGTQSYYSNLSTHLTNVTIPESVKSIGDYAFNGCAGLTDIVIPAGVTSIGEYAFANCSNLSNITLPAGLQQIEDNAFNNCHGLKKITLPNGLLRIGRGAFYSCDVLASVNIPEGVTEIGDDAFSSCSALTRVTLPNTLKRIGANAFYQCIKLSSITLPSSVTEIGSYAFYYCIRLKTVTIPSGVKTIETYTFYYCSNLKNVGIPVSVKNIENHAFHGCSALTDVYYTSSQGMWNTIGIEASNVPLQNADKHFYSTPPAELTTEISPLAVTADTIKANIYCEDGVSANAICALYDADGRMLSTEIVSLTAGENNEVSFARNASAQTAKVLVMDASSSPLCASVTAKQ